MLIAWNNLWDTGSVTAGSTLTGYDANRTQHPQLSKQWRTAAATKSSYLICDLASAQSCSVLAVLGTNLTSSSTFRARGRNVADNYLSLPGTSGNYASTPDSTENSVTGDIDIRVKVALDDWTPGSNSYFLGKWGGDPNRAYLFGVVTSGVLVLETTVNGNFATRVTGASTAAPTVSDGNPLWVRVTLDVNDGAGNRVYKFYTSADGQSWTQLGATVTTVGATTVANTGNALVVGASSSTGADFSGKLYYAEVRNGIDGTVVAQFDPSNSLSGDLSVPNVAGQTAWTINTSGSPAAAIVGWLVDTGTVSSAVVTGYGAIYKTFTATSSRYWRIDIEDTTVASNLHVGRVFLGPSWTPTYGHSYGWSVGWLDESRRLETYGGQTYIDRRNQARVLNFSLDWNSEAQMFGNAFALAKAQGLASDVLVIPDTAGSYVSQQAVWGLLAESTPIRNELVGVWRQRFTVKERL